MTKIWKFPIEIVDEQQIAMPDGARILCVQVQRGVPCIWAEVSPGVREVHRTLLIHGTGHDVSVRAKKYVGTFQTDGGDFVWHLFDAGVG